MDTILDQQESIALTKWHIQEKRLDKALLQIKPVLSGDRVDPEAVLIAARLYAQLQLFGHAQVLFSQHLEKNKDDLPTQFQLGMCYFDNQDREKALSTWESILKKEAHHPPALFYSAIALLQKNETESAVKHLKNIMDTAQVDNLYYTKAKELMLEIEKKSPNIGSISSQEIYQTEH